MKLYDFPFSPNCRKVRAVAYELGIALEYEHVDLLNGGSRTPAYLARNPNGRVPVLEDGDLILWESTAIIRYLAAGSALAPTAPRLAAEVDRWISWQLAHLGPAMSKVAFENIVKRLTRRGEPDAARIAEGTAEFEQLTAILDAALAGREFVAGPLTLADFALGAHYSIAAAAGLDISRHHRVESWLARISARDSMKRALADAQGSL
ncbi:MAG: glutathione S-transferase family protein [Deltaproteobacteria bacterium]|nr:MAG: glutathione S-transferase family protein [Deltaproteobacteria bacterium]TMQ23634.1 MAG: glutathione S-transferase family protein [Deltaproteobacteria bacterium]